LQELQSLKGAGIGQIGHAKKGITGKKQETPKGAEI
jgi:hypothetical protein